MKNVNVSGESKEQENVDSKVKQLLEKLKEKPHTEDCWRIFQSKTDAAGIPRPIRFIR